MTEQETQKSLEYQLEFAKKDYDRLGNQELRLMDKRGGYRKELFTIVGIPVAAVGAIGLQGAIYLLTLIPFLITCIALEVKHDEKVLRYDVRKQMKLLAREWGFENHDSKFAEHSEHQQRRWWHGYYKIGRSAAFLVAEVVAASVVTWYFTSVPVYGLTLSVVLAILNTFFVVFTAWCMK